VKIMSLLRPHVKGGTVLWLTLFMLSEAYTPDYYGDIVEGSVPLYHALQGDPTHIYVVCLH
jgi:hypothetical protein